MIKNFAAGFGSPHNGQSENWILNRNFIFLRFLSAIAKSAKKKESPKKWPYIQT